MWGRALPVRAAMLKTPGRPVARSCGLLRPLAALLIATALAAPAWAQADSDSLKLQPGDVIDFAADRLSYDDKAEIVTAIGNVVIVREGYRLRADTVAYNRGTGQVEARGNVVVIDPGGNQAFGDRVEITDTLRDAAIENILVVLQDGGRLAARSGTRVNNVSTLRRAVYSPCDIGGSDGCPREPVWQIKALRVIHNPASQRIAYRDAWFELFGVPVLYLPSMSHPDGSGGNASGLLVPDIRVDRQLGLELSLPVYLRFSQSNDLTISPTIYTEANPSLGATYRHMTTAGPFQIGGIGTSASRVDSSGASRDGFRGYFFGNGRFQFNPKLRATFGARYSTDDTFLRRYDISRDVTLRNFASLEHFGGDSYLSVSGWAFQSLRAGDRQGQSPIALPLVDFQWQPDFPGVGGRFDIRANTMAVTRTSGEDVRRALTSVEYDITRITPAGQRITLVGLVRGDLYNIDQSGLAGIAAYAGRDGWRTRGIAAGAVDLEWPLAGTAFGGVQTLTPRVQFVAASNGQNSKIPNEDSRAVELEDLNLFDINRFSGYDRWEGSARVTYGGRWTLDRPRLGVIAEVGQSYRVSDKPSIFPDGTGLAGRFSDIVGRTSLRFSRFVDFTHRYRFDKDSLSVRRNEIDITVGGRRNFVEVGYLRLNRDITFEDLPDREELRAGGRVQLARFWSAFGSVIFDLTDRTDDPTSAADGFEPVRHRIGVAYEDECLQFGVTWRRDYTSDRDFRRGNTFLLTLSLKNLGR